MGVAESQEDPEAPDHQEEGQPRPAPQPRLPVQAGVVDVARLEPGPGHLVIIIIIIINIIIIIIIIRSPGTWGPPPAGAAPAPR